MTRRFVVFKTVVPFGEATQFVLGDERNAETPYLMFGSLETLAAELRAQGGQEGDELRLIKNDLPGDIMWAYSRHRPLSRVRECTRLSGDEVRELVRLLQS
jgi:hypothetical protein